MSPSTFGCDLARLWDSILAMTNFDSILHPVTICQVMLNFAANLGVDEATCLQETGITQQVLQDSDGLITRAQEMRLVENMIAALPQVSGLGFQLGLQYSVATFGVWGFALRTSRTLREAANLAVRYLPLSTAYCELSTIDEKNDFGMRLDASAIPKHVRQFFLERDAATGVNLLKELSLAGVNIKVAEFQIPTPEYAHFMEQACGVKPIFNSSRNAILFSAEDADKALPTYDSHLVRLLDEQCRLQLQRRHTTGVSGKVRELILGPLGFVATLDAVANALAMSARSLRRKLELEDTSFRTLIEEERRQLALQLLTASDMKLDELAIHLGYTDTASFNRAFRRWMQCSPGEYRKNQNVSDKETL